MPKSSSAVRSLSARTYFTSQDAVIPMPDLIEVQKDSYAWFLKEGLADLFDEISPITDFIGRELELHFGKYYLALVLDCFFY